MLRTGSLWGTCHEDECHHPSKAHGWVTLGWQQWRGWEVEPASWVHCGCIKKGVSDTSGDFGLGLWKPGVASQGWSRFEQGWVGWAHQKFRLGHVHLEISMRCLSVYGAISISSYRNLLRVLALALKHFTKLIPLETTTKARNWPWKIGEFFACSEILWGSFIQPRVQQ